MLRVFFVRSRWDKLARTGCEVQKAKTAEGRLKVQSKRLDAHPSGIGAANSALSAVRPVSKHWPGDRAILLPKARYYG
jgi:hypothetical protein